MFKMNWKFTNRGRKEIWKKIWVSFYFPITSKINLRIAFAIFWRLTSYLQSHFISYFFRNKTFSDKDNGTFYTFTVKVRSYSMNAQPNNRQIAIKEYWKVAFTQIGSIWNLISNLKSLNEYSEWQMRSTSLWIIIPFIVANPLMCVFGELINTQWSFLPFRNDWKLKKDRARCCYCNFFGVIENKLINCLLLWKILFG